MKGIKNIGNSCYLNSALQLLLNTNMTSDNTTYNEFVNNYKYGKGNVINPINIKNIVSKVNPMFNNNNQHDSFEFLVFLLDIINNNKPFQFTLNIDIKCKLKTCLKSRNKYEKELFLCLPLLDTLDNSYRKFKEVESFRTDIMLECDYCNRKTPSRKMIIMDKWPNELIIVLKRFDERMKKNNNNINIPINWRHGYQLKGFILHSGSYFGGHYVYYGKYNNQWFLFNDSHVDKVNNINQILPKSYILHYQKNIDNNR
jgi:ubiquitin C-terminal hydrolase